MSGRITAEPATRYKRRTKHKRRRQPIRLGQVCMCPAAPRRGPQRQPHEHGCVGRYWGRPPMGGCRCAECRTGYAAVIEYVPAVPQRCYCKVPPPYQYRGYREHQHGCWGRYHSTRDRCRCEPCRNAYMKRQRELQAKQPDWVVVHRLVHGFQVQATPREKVEAIRRMRGHGVSLLQMADRLRMAPRSVVRICAEYNIPLDERIAA
jgi:hypothetical protein